MELKGERRLAAGRATAWKALNDVELLKLCVPDCASFTVAGENRYEVVMNTAVGPLQSRFKGTVQVTDIDPPNSYAMRFDGNGGAAGFVRGEVRVTLAAATGATTQLAYAARVQVGGTLAQVDAPLIDAAAGAMADKFFETFDARLRARAAAELEETTLHVDADLSKPLPPPPPAARPGFWGLLRAFLRRLFRRR